MKKRKKIYLALIILTSLLLVIDGVIFVKTKPTFGNYSKGNMPDMSQMTGSDIPEMPDGMGSSIPEMPSGSDGQAAAMQPDASADTDSTEADTDSNDTDAAASQSGDSTSSDTGSNAQFGGAPSGMAGGHTNNKAARYRIICIPVGILLLLLDIFFIFKFFRKKKKVSEEKEEEVYVDPALLREKKRKKARIRNTALLAVLLVIVIVLQALSGASSSSSGSSTNVSEEVVTATAEKADIDDTLVSYGTVASADEVSIDVPGDISVLKYYVSVGDTVKAGDKIAAVDRDSVMAAIADIEDLVEDLDTEVEDVIDGSISSSLKASVDGTVVKVYAKAGESVVDTMYEHGALMLLSLDDLLAVDIENTGDYTVGDTLKVTDSDGNSHDGTVSNVEKETITVTVDLDDFDFEDEVKVSDDGKSLGSDKLYIYNQLKVTGYSGTVKSVSVKKGSSVSSGKTLLTLKDTDYTADYQVLLNKRNTLVDQYNTLIDISNSGYVTAESDGVISSIDEDLLTDEAKEEAEEEEAAKEAEEENSSEDADSASDADGSAAKDNIAQTKNSDAKDAGSDQAASSDTSASASQTSAGTLSSMAVSENQTAVSTIAVSAVKILPVSEILSASEEGSEGGDAEGGSGGGSEGGSGGDSEGGSGGDSEGGSGGDSEGGSGGDSEGGSGGGSESGSGGSSESGSGGSSESGSGGSSESGSGSSDDSGKTSGSDSSDTSSQTTTKTVVCKWLDAQGNTLTQGAPSSLSVKLQADGKSKDTQTLSAKNNWTYTWKDLPAYNGKISISYTAACDVPSGFTGSYTLSGDTITLVFTQSQQDQQQMGQNGLAGLMGGMSGKMGGMSGFGGSMSGMGGGSLSAGFGSSAAGTDSETTEEEDTTYTFDDTTLGAYTPNDQVSVDITVDELDVNSLSIGQQAQVTLDALTGQSFEGEITSIDPEGTNSGGNTKYTATVTMDKTEDMLLGMNASVSLVMDAENDVLSVPAEALVEQEGKVYVYTSYDEKKDELSGLTEVTCGLSDGENVEIKSGLSDGDTFYYRYADTISYNFLGHSK